MKTRRYHFDGEPFIHPLYSVRFYPDRPYELPIQFLLALRRRDAPKEGDPSPQGSGPSRRASPTPQYSPLSPMYEGDEVEDKKVSEDIPCGVDDVKKIEEEEEEEEE
ncbi:hypothetical protein PIB30_068120 [Stylosanthes scabra]|uniref:Uncharacterized protein n=1 Tax=Stylosanthes scabra TaxID=79078 RepID=A0ABU6TPE1_9FABA|nr:hypothetical protein [Stylosanthes scabra]